MKPSCNVSGTPPPPYLTCSHHVLNLSPAVPQYVTAAKMVLQNSEAMIAIDMPAGPSEVLVMADAAANAAHVAADLLSQAEHGPDSQVGDRGGEVSFRELTQAY